jgi:outer membrane protein OmpA-like peptidoglycan-associated protein
MKQNYGKIVVLTALLCALCVGLAYGASNGNKVKVSGLITMRTGDGFVLKTPSSGNVKVELTDDTKVVQPKGVLKLRKADMGMTALMPGLKVTVEGTGDVMTSVVAVTVKFSKDDLQAAEAIQAGLTPTQQQVDANGKAIATNQQNIEANKQGIAANQANIAANQKDIEANQKAIADANKRFEDLTDFDVKGSATVYFASGKATIEPKDQAALTKLSQDALGLKGYLVQVKGFADSTGNAAMNQRLSMERAQAVIAYLLQTGKIPLRHIVAPGAMGEADPAAPNETAQGRKENRRVEVKVLVNRGIAGGN